MKGYKAFNGDMTCRGFQYEIGKTYEIDQKIGLCESGFHFCKQPAQVFKYYDKDARVCEVEASGEIIEGDGKCVCSKITILHELVGFERGRLNYGNGYGYGYGNGNGNGYGYGYGNGHGNGHGDGYGNGYGNGDGRNINRVLIFKEV